MTNIKKAKYTMSLNALFDEQPVINHNIEISGLSADSRDIKPGDLFIAYRGTTYNGVDFIDDAIAAGAVAVVVDKQECVDFDDKSVTFIELDRLHDRLGFIASRFFGHPSENIALIGVTGTNGKTTVTCMIAHALSQLGQQTALIGTLGYGQYHHLAKAHMTTPDAICLQQLFSSWQSHIDTVAMEVSSHALAQGRVNGTMFDTAILTNISRDHLDYHTTFEEYVATKYQLFHTPGLKYAIINIDNVYGMALIRQLSPELGLVVYSKNVIKKYVFDRRILYVYVAHMNQAGLNTRIKIKSSFGQVDIDTCLVGQANVENLLAAFAALCVSGIAAEVAARSLAGFIGIPGRMEYFSSANKPLIVVDYAHTPDALSSALSTLRSYCKGRLTCVFGCGGDRDVGKREQMGSIAEAYADRVFITDDNPRHEDPEKITADILRGFKDKNSPFIQHDRHRAIVSAVTSAAKEDVILIAGKGHEMTQEVAGIAHPFSDRQIASQLVEVS